MGDAHGGWFEAEGSNRSAVTVTHPLMRPSARVGACKLKSPVATELRLHCCRAAWIDALASIAKLLVNVARTEVELQQRLEVGRRHGSNRHPPPRGHTAQTMSVVVDDEWYTQPCHALHTRTAVRLPIFAFTHSCCSFFFTRAVSVRWTTGQK